MLNEKNLLKIIRAGVYLALLTPLVFISQTIFGTVFGKILYFQIMVELTLPFFLYLIIFNKDIRPKLDTLTKLILGFFAVIFITSIFGLDFSKSFWGYDERMRGLFTMLHFLALYFYIITVFRGANNRRRILFFIILVGIAVSAFGIIERINPGVRIDKSINASEVGHRISSTTGNPIFLSGYLIFIFFLSLYYFAVNKINLRWVALFGVLTSFIAILASGTRGSALGLFSGIVVMLFLLFILSSKKRKIFIGIGTFLFLIMLAFAFIADVGGLKKGKYNILNRITSISLTEASGQQRLMLWNVGKNAFLDRPLLGWGLENFDYAFDKHYDPRFLRFNINQTWADRAHNIYIDWLVMSGIFGLLFYLSIFIYIFYVLLRRYLLQKNLALIGLITGFSVYSIFGLDSPSIMLMLFVTFAIISLLFNDSEEIGVSGVKKNNTVFIIILLPVLLSVYFFNLKPLNAGINFISFLHTYDVIEKQELAENFLNPSSPYKYTLRQRFANEIFLEAGDTGYSTEYKRWGLDRAIEELELSYKERSQEFSYPFTLGNLYLRKASVFSDVPYSKSMSYYDDALLLSPNRQAVIFQHSTALLLDGKYDEAIKLLENVISLDEQSGQAYWRIASVYVAEGDGGLAYKNFTRSIELGFIGFIKEEVVNATSLCIQSNDYICITKLYTNLGDRSVGKERADYFAKAAVGFAILGDIDQAIEFIQMAMDIDASLKEGGEIFLQQLQSRVE